MRDRDSQRIERHLARQSSTGTDVHIVLIALDRPGLQTSIHWPIDQMDMSGHWLREVLA